MKKGYPSMGVLIFFTAALIISTAIILKKDEPESIETMNTLSGEYSAAVESTDLLPEDTETDSTAEGDDGFPLFGGNFDIATAPIFGRESDEAQTVVPDHSGDDGYDEYEDSYEYDDAPAYTTAAVQTTRTVITSRERKAYDSNSVYIDMENILQEPELPVGCEITALTALLRFYGFNAEKTDMARNYLPTSWGNAQTIDGKLYKDSFFDYFIGDPFSRGYGCFSPAIERAANRYIADHGGGYTVKNISGCHPDTLYEYLIKDIPVLCWATDGMIEPEYYETWYDNATGEQLDWYLNEHCFVLTGFNIANSTVTLNDPMKGIIDYNIDRFEVRFKQMYSQAIVILPEGGSYTEAAETVAAEPAETAPPVETETGSETETAAPADESTEYETEITSAEQSETETETEETTSETEAITEAVTESAAASDTTVWQDVTSPWG